MAWSTWVSISGTWNRLRGWIQEFDESESRLGQVTGYERSFLFRWREDEAAKGYRGSVEEGRGIEDNGSTSQAGTLENPGTLTWHVMQ